MSKSYFDKYLSTYIFGSRSTNRRISRQAEAISDRLESVSLRFELLDRKGQHLIAVIFIRPLISYKNREDIRRSLVRLVVECEHVVRVAVGKVCVELLALLHRSSNGVLGVEVPEDKGLVRD